jgi:hypothetical protein
MEELHRRRCCREDKVNHMMFLLSRTDLRYHEEAIAADAQTERRGGARPVEWLS